MCFSEFFPDEEEEEADGQGPAVDASGQYAFQSDSEFPLPHRWSRFPAPSSGINPSRSSRRIRRDSVHINITRVNHHPPLCILHCVYVADHPRSASCSIRWLQLWWPIGYDTSRYLPSLSWTTPKLPRPGFQPRVLYPRPHSDCTIPPPFPIFKPIQHLRFPPVPVPVPATGVANCNSP